MPANSPLRAGFASRRVFTTSLDKGLEGSAASDDLLPVRAATSLDFLDFLFFFLDFSTVPVVGSSAPSLPCSDCCSVSESDSSCSSGGTPSGWDSAILRLPVDYSEVARKGR